VEYSILVVEVFHDIVQNFRLSQKVYCHFGDIAIAIRATSKVYGFIVIHIKQ
jgi:hypothetical protein